MRSRILIVLIALFLLTPLNLKSDDLLNRCDVNRDGFINIQDLVLVSNNIGKSSDFPMNHIHVVGDRVRGFVRRINDNPNNSFIGLSNTTAETLNTEFKFYVPASTWETKGLVELLYRQLNIDVRVTNLRPDGTYDATVISIIQEGE